MIFVSNTDDYEVRTVRNIQLWVTCVNCESYNARDFKYQRNYSIIIVQSNYEPLNRNNDCIGQWSWYYRGCWHQTCPPLEIQIHEQ